MPAYQELLIELEREFTHAFGGCTIFRGLAGSYLSRLGLDLKDRINLIVVDTPVRFTRRFEFVSQYTDQVRKAVVAALEEEAVLVVAFPVYHSE